MADKGHKDLEKLNVFFFFPQAKAVQVEPVHSGCPEELPWLPREASHSASACGPAQHWDEAWTAGPECHLE